MAWVAGLVSVVGSLGAAILYLATNAWFGSSDLVAMLLWSLPLGLLVGVTVQMLARPVDPAPSVAHYLALATTGGVLGAVWTITAALLLGGWISAFSFPVLFCWVAGGILGGTAAAWVGRRRTWLAPLAVVAAVLLVLGRLNAYVQAPGPRLRVIVKPDAAPEEVQRVWDEVLGRATGRPGEHALIPGIASVAASAGEGASVALTITLEKRLSREEQAQLVAMIRQSPLVARVDTVLRTDTTGVRTSVTY